MESFLDSKKLKIYLFIIIIIFLIAFNVKADCPKSLKLNADVAYNKNLPLSNQILILTDFGPILIALNTDKSPISTKLFSQIVRTKYYNKTTFYRMYDYYFIQAGDPSELGNGNIGIEFPDSEKTNSIITEGTVALTTNITPPQNSGSQFFITFVRSEWLDNKYIVIGNVIYGLDILKSFFGKYTTDSKGFIKHSIPFEMYILEDYIKQNPDLESHFIPTDYTQIQNNENIVLEDNSLEKIITTLFTNSNNINP